MKKLPTEICGCCDCPFRYNLDDQSIFIYCRLLAYRISFGFDENNPYKPFPDDCPLEEA